VQQDRRVLQAFLGYKKRWLKKDAATNKANFYIQYNLWQLPKT